MNVALVACMWRPCTHPPWTIILGKIFPQTERRVEYTSASLFISSAEHFQLSHNFTNTFSPVPKKPMYPLHPNLVSFCVTSMSRTTSSSFVWNRRDRLGGPKFGIDDLIVLGTEGRGTSGAVEESASAWTMTIGWPLVWISVNGRVVAQRSSIKFVKL